MLIFCSLWLCGCMPSPEEVLAGFNRDIIAGQPGNSLPVLQDMAKNGSEEDFLLWHLLAGSSAMLSEQSDASIEQFDLAEDLFSANDHRSPFLKNSAALLVNERIIHYHGSGQERIFCSFYKALQYAAQNNRNAARTELNRAMERQENWLFERRKEIAAAGEAMEKAAASGKKDQNFRHKTSVSNAVKNTSLISLLQKHCAFDMRRSGNISALTPGDYQNAYITHFCGIYRTLNGDNGLPYLKDAARLLPDNPLIAADLDDAGKNGFVSNSVWIYIEDGLCPVRREVRFDLPLFLIPYANRYILYAGMALPALTFRGKGAENFRVMGKEFIELENIDRLLKTDFDVYMFSAVKREITRCITRAAAQAAMGIAAENSSNDALYVSLHSARISAAAYAAASTRADLRNWSALPKRVLFQRIQRPADGRISISGGNALFEAVLPPGNHIIWLRKVSPAAPFQHKLISFP